MARGFLYTVTDGPRVSQLQMARGFHSYRWPEGFTVTDGPRVSQLQMARGFLYTVKLYTVKIRVHEKRNR